MAQNEPTDDYQSRLMQEWSAARDVLKTFDDRIHDLRKYGFTFITGLISVQGFLLPFIPSAGNAASSATATGSSGIPDDVKFGVLIATTILIVVLRWFDGNYQGFQYGAAIRAKIIERFLNLELTDEISTSYEVQKLWFPKIVLYFGFEAAVVGLAWALLPLHRLDWIIYLAAAIVVESGVYYKLGDPEKHRTKPKQDNDWALDKLRCSKGDQVQIMMTYLGPVANITLRQAEAIWIIKDNAGIHKHTERMADTVTLLKDQSFLWSWTVDVDPGIYRIVVNVENKDTIRELDRKLEVVIKPNSQDLFEKIQELTKLKDRHVITEKEFECKKTELLAKL
jgi:hypothetical protein